jgi:proteasome accessory factor A
VYGAQENYQAQVARGPALWAYRFLVGLFVVPAALFALVFWILAIGMVLTDAFISAIRIFRARRADPHAENPRAWVWDSHWDSLPWERRIGAQLIHLNDWVLNPLLVPFAALLRLFVFRKQRRDLLPFLVSRIVFTGAGTLLEDGVFALSEKAPAMRRVHRTSINHENRPLFDPANFFKNLMSFAEGRPGEVFRLFAAQNRLQLGFSDSNMAQVAEYLKVGVTALMVEMSEAGFLKGGPRLADPIEALQTLVRDPDLKATVPLKGGGRTSALSLQHHYLDRARQWMEIQPATNIQVAHLIKLWGWVLVNLKSNPSSLVGQVDWITKRFVLEKAGSDLSWEAQKKIDLSYHEMGTGLFAQLESMGLCPSVVSDDKIDAAIKRAPSDTPAHFRGQLIAELARDNIQAKVTWDRVRVGGPLTGKVIRIDFKKEGEDGN